MAQCIEMDMTISTERKGLLHLGPSGTHPTQPNNSTQPRAPWTNNYKRGPNDNSYQQPSTNYRPKSPNDHRSNQYQEKQARGP